jgi:hypothetical protein
MKNIIISIIVFVTLIQAKGCKLKNTKTQINTYLRKIP